MTWLFGCGIYANSLFISPLLPPSSPKRFKLSCKWFNCSHLEICCKFFLPPATSSLGWDSLDTVLRAYAWPQNQEMFLAGMPQLQCHKTSAENWRWRRRAAGSLFLWGVSSLFKFPAHTVSRGLYFRSQARRYNWKNIGLGFGEIWFTFHICHLLVTWFWTSNIILLHLNYLTCEVEVHWLHHKEKWITVVI